MVLAARLFDGVANENGLTLIVCKIKLLVTGTGLTDDDMVPSELD